MHRTDYFNEALITAMLAAEADSREPPGPPAAQVQGIVVEDPDAADRKTADVNLTQAPGLRSYLVRLLDDAVRRAVAAGLDRTLAETADFAVCAFIDEILLSSAWAGRAEWMIAPLQLVRHNTATAGEDFYRILDVLLEKAGPGGGDAVSAARNEASRGGPETPAGQEGLSGPEAPAGQEEENASPEMLGIVLEVFALCLSRGFTGMYFNDAAAREGKLAAIARFVPAVANGVGENQRLFPAAYPASPARKNPLNRLRRFDGLDWLLWLIPPLVTGLLYLVYDLRLDALLTLFTEGSLLL
ncbi:MAG: DotU family type IV/VI secretion system protein [Desulfovibrio sp.]|jgi:type VI secretion system protein ImpK|nr:DotU family type IV/VI secretion system protein [Desulfovibrio sp.]